MVIDFLELDCLNFVSSWSVFSLSCDLEEMALNFGYLNLLTVHHTVQVMLYARVRNQPITALCFEFENELKLYILEARPASVTESIVLYRRQSSAKAW